MEKISKSLCLQTSCGALQRKELLAELGTLEQTQIQIQHWPIKKHKYKYNTARPPGTLGAFFMSDSRRADDDEDMK